MDALLQFLQDGDLIPHFQSSVGVFCFIALLASVLALGVTFLSVFFDGDAGGGDTPEDGNGDGWISLRTLVGFLLGFGWTGFLLLRAGHSLGVAIAAGIGVGLLLFVFLALLMRSIYGLRADGTLRYETLIGLKGHVYVTIPPAGESGGQVQVSHPSQLLTLPAVQHGTTPLPSGTLVVIADVQAGLVRVEPFSQP